MVSILGTLASALAPKLVDTIGQVGGDLISSIG